MTQRCCLTLIWNATRREIDKVCDGIENKALEEGLLKDIDVCKACCLVVKRVSIEGQATRRGGTTVLYIDRGQTGCLDGLAIIATVLSDWFGEPG